VSSSAPPDLSARVAALDWPRIEADLNARGYATTGVLLTPTECAGLIDGYDNDDLFRSRVVMARHGFGRGEYKYYAYALPDSVAELRGAFYQRLTSIANRWPNCNYPSDHQGYLDLCHRAGQCQPTALILKYQEGDYNCLHQDLYGDLFFPLQTTFLLSRDFAGGEFVLTEQRPRMQSRVEVVPLQQGEAVIFAVNQRPVQGSRGLYHVAMRHGVSRIRSGRRFTLGIIFHDAR
jgi:hypothetical protein